MAVIGGLCAPSMASVRDPWVKTSVPFKDIVDAEPDGNGGLWVLAVELSGENDVHRLVRVDSGGRKTPTATTVTGALADSEQLDPDGSGGVVITGPFEAQADAVIGVTSQGRQYSLKSPCNYEQSVGDNSGGAWVQCVNSPKYVHLTVDGRTYVGDFSKVSNSLIRADGAWMMYPDGVGGFWGFVWQRDESSTLPRLFQLVSVDRQGGVHFDSRTYTGKGDTVDVELNRDGSVRVAKNRIVAPGFATTLNVPGDIGDVDADCGLGNGSVQCLISVGSAEWRAGSREWRIASQHPAEGESGTFTFSDSVVRGEHVWARYGIEQRLTWWKSDRKGRVSMLKGRKMGPFLWPAVRMTSGGVSWWQIQHRLDVVDVKRIPWKRLPGRLQTVTIASPDAGTHRALPRKTDQGTAVAWRSLKKSRCTVHDGRINWRSNYCTLVARAAGHSPWVPYRAQFNLARRIS